MNLRFVTFSIGGALKGYYAEFVADPEIDIEEVLRKYCAAHFPKDWSFMYDSKEFKGQVENHRLTKLATYMWQHDSFYVVACRVCGNPRCEEAHAA